MLQGATSWDNLSDDQKEKTIESTLTIAFNAGKNKTLPKDMTIKWKWWGLMGSYTYAFPEMYDKFMVDNSDWIPNRIAAKERQYELSFDYKQPLSDYPATTDPTTTTTTTTGTTTNLPVATTPDATKGMDWKVMAGIGVAAALGLYLLYNILNKPKS